MLMDTAEAEHVLREVAREFINATDAANFSMFRCWLAFPENHKQASRWMAAWEAVGGPTMEGDEIEAFRLWIFNGEYVQWLKSKGLRKVLRRLESSMEIIPLAELPDVLKSLEKVKVLGRQRLAEERS